MNNTAAKTAFNLANHPRYQWGDGALALRWAPGYADHLKVGYRVDRNMVESGFTQGLVPDLNDPATIGTIEAQTRAFYQNLIVYPPDYPGDDWAISRGPMSGDGQTCVAYAPTRGDCWALAFLEVAK